MFPDRRDRWADSLLWGVTAALVLLAVGAVAAVAFNGWTLFVGR